MNYEKCYFDKDLRVYYYNFNEITDIIDELSGKSKYESYYRIIWMKGISTVYIGKKSFQFTDPIIFIAPPNVPVSWFCKKTTCESICIEIHPKILSDLPQKDKVLDFFYKLKDEQAFFNLAKPHNNDLNLTIELLKSGLFAHSGRFHILARIYTIISEMCMIYESKYTEYIASTDSIPVQIIDYINKNYTNNITLDMISEKFFVSKPTILAVVKRITGFAFKEYLTNLRLDTAVKLLKTSEQTAQKVAILCGFNEYSAFYKAFRKKYGFSPKKLIKKNDDSFPLK